MFSPLLRKKTAKEMLLRKDCACAILLKELQLRRKVMKLKFFGTAAAEAFPGVFCNCEHCIEARRLGGKNIRSRSQSLVNEDLLIDLPADTYWHFMSNGIRGDKIKYLLITHSHYDHLYPTELRMRIPPYAHNMQEPELQVFCSAGAYKKITEQIPNPKNFTITEVKAFETFKVGDYEVTPLPARHAFGDEAVFYIIKGDKTLLYAHDTGYFYDEVFDYIKEKAIRFDLMTFDCTYCLKETEDTDSHMGLPNVEKVVARLKEMGAADDNTLKFINHYSHNGGPLQHLLEEGAPGYGVAYDGREVDF